MLQHGKLSLRMRGRDHPTKFDIHAEKLEIDRW